MNIRHIVLTTLLFAGLGGTAVAQGRGTEADQDACTPDVFRLCSDFVPNENQIVQCLQSKPRQLSPACHQVFFPTPSAAPKTIPVDDPARKPHLHFKHHKHVAR